MIGRLVRGAMNLARPIEYFVQTGWTIFVSFECLLLLSGFRAAESGIDCRVLGVITVVLTLVSVVSRLVFVAFNFRGAGVACIVFATGQPNVLARIKEGH